MPDGTLTCREELICQQFERFYSDLYSVEEVDPTDIEEYLDSAPVVRLSLVDSATLENDITPTEVLVAIQCLKQRKRQEEESTTNKQEIGKYDAIGSTTMCFPKCTVNVVQKQRRWRSDERSDRGRKKTLRLSAVSQWDD
ncbi:hypothetical protein NDU88_009618 [Pleurodeles waltl]|uniref:Uncharacterized protein n=1 Tax=Pleurodeles waltl TaxID=8319 RepID=A0AAV7QY16_PLEWA|nr:hypothetical protein NDU88_009618 [Pleurodeles waltl]